MCRIAPSRVMGWLLWVVWVMCKRAIQREGREVVESRSHHAPGSVTNCRVATSGRLRSPQRTTQMGRTPLGGCTCRIAPLHVVGWLLVVMDRVCHATSARRVRTAKFTQFHEPWERIPGGADGDGAHAGRTTGRKCAQDLLAKVLGGRSHERDKRA